LAFLASKGDLLALGISRLRGNRSSHRSIPVRGNTVRRIAVVRSVIAIATTVATPVTATGTATAEVHAEAAVEIAVAVTITVVVTVVTVTERTPGWQRKSE
jgi:hypothetical protein